MIWRFVRPDDSDASGTTVHNLFCQRFLQFCWAHYGTDHGRVAEKFNQQSRTAGSVLGVAPRLSDNHQSHSNGGPSPNPIQVNSRSGHNGPGPSLANTPYLSATSYGQGTNVTDWTDSSGRSRQDSNLNGAFVIQEVKVGRMREKPLARAVQSLL